MPDEPNPEIDQFIAELFQPEWYRQEEICSQVGIGPDLFALCLQWEVIHPTHTNQEGENLFPPEALDRLCRGLRLHRDLGINWAGVAVALELLERIEKLERNLPHSAET